MVALVPHLHISVGKVHTLFAHAALINAMVAASALTTPPAPCG